MVTTITTKSNNPEQEDCCRLMVNWLRWNQFIIYPTTCKKTGVRESYPSSTRTLSCELQTCPMLCLNIFILATWRKDSLLPLPSRKESYHPPLPSGSRC